jgi:hypothetical protein
MSSSRDYRLADQATPVHAGDTVQVRIAKGIFQERGTFTVTLREHPEVPGLLMADLHEREIVIQRPNGDQPLKVTVAA